MKAKVAILSVIFMVAWIVGLGCYPLVTWSPLNCSHEDIDINTGRIRHQRFLLGICVSERIENSPISATLQRDHVAPDWRHAVTLSPLMNYSPHYAFHSAVNQTQLLEIIWQTARSTPEAKTESCQAIIKLWQSSQRDDSADDYLQALSALALDRRSDAQPLTADELPGA